MFGSNQGDMLPVKYVCYDNNCDKGSDLGTATCLRNVFESDHVDMIPVKYVS